MKIIMYDGKNWTISTEKGSANAHILNHVMAIVENLEKNFGLMATPENPLCFDLSAPIWDFTED